MNYQEFLENKKHLIGDFGFEPNYIIEIGDSKYKKTGKHNLLTTMELMSLRYYSIYYPDVKDNIIE